MVEHKTSNGRNIRVLNLSFGTDSRQLPKIDPLAHAASDPRGTTTVSDDALASFSSSGVPGATGSKNPDLLAPGKSVASLRLPGSFLDESFRSVAQLGEDNFRGSGTSQAAAVISGAAALILQQRPSITPDQLKKLLTSTATALPAVKPEGQGKGVVNLAKALSTNTPRPSRATTPPPGPAA